MLYEREHGIRTPINLSRHMQQYIRRVSKAFYKITFHQSQTLSSASQHICYNRDFFTCFGPVYSHTRNAKSKPPNMTYTFSYTLYPNLFTNRLSEHSDPTSPRLDFCLAAGCSHKYCSGTLVVASVQHGRRRTTRT